MNLRNQHGEMGSGAAGEPRGGHWWEAPFWQAAVGSLLFAAALPPLSLGPLGWLAPVPWLLLVQRGDLRGRRPYVQIYLAGVLFWLLSLHWLRLPHPATSIGWIAVALYMGCYVPAFVGLGRVAVHSLKVPLWIAGPVVWTGLELVRAHLLTGFLMASIAHTQIGSPLVLQIADLGGEYLVDFVLVLVAACLAEAWTAGRELITRRTPRSSPATSPVASLITSMAVATVVLAGTLGYGAWRLGQETLTPGPRVALIQGNSLAEWKADPSRAQRIMNEYTQVSVEAVRAARRSESGRSPDLIVWPETMFRGTIFEFEPGYESSSTKPPESDIDQYLRAGPERIARLVEILQAPVLLGVDVVRFLADPPHAGREYASWNAAVLADEEGAIVGRYAKVHLVMFGEYIPFAEYLPWLYEFTPLAGGIMAGEGPVALRSRGVVYAPNICYESVLPHVIRRQVARLSAAGTRPDVLVNLTNDAWYWGSSELDMHLASGVMRAIENRAPHLVAANGGISAHIDSCGRILEQSPRQETDFILADVRLDARQSLYSRIGDWFAGVCLAGCALLAIVGVKRRPANGASGRD